MSRTRRDKPWRGKWPGADPMDAGLSVYHSRRCFGKLSYPTKAKALRAKRNKQRAYGKRYRVYKCPFCDHYHLSTSAWRR